MDKQLTKYPKKEKDLKDWLRFDSMSIQKLVGELFATFKDIGRNGILLGKLEQQVSTRDKNEFYR